MQIPLVSVGLLAYNRPVGLRRALECLTQQSHGNLEIIVSDNASALPEVQPIIQEFAAKDSRIKPFKQKENIGALGNFRFVFEQATAEFYMWAADDDEWDADFVSVCLANLLNPKHHAVLSFCHVRKRDAAGKILQPNFSDTVSCDSSRMLRRSWQYLYHSGGNHSFYGIYRKSSINEWFFQKRFGSDHLALLVLLRQGGIHIDPRVLFTSTIGGGGFERKSFHKYYDATFMKICVNLSSTLTWWYEFLRCIWLTPYRLREKLVLSFFTCIRFSRPRYLRRFAGDMLALFTKPEIWYFRNR